MSADLTTSAAATAELAELVLNHQATAAIELAQQLLAEPELEGAERAAVLFLQGRALYRMENAGRGSECYRQALELYAEAGDEENVLRCQLGLAHDKMGAGLYPEAQHLTAQVLQVAQQQGWARLVAEAQLQAGLICNREHRYRDSLNYLGPAVVYFAQHPAGSPVRDAQDALAWAETGSGDLEGGRLRAERLYAELEAEQCPLDWLALVLNTLIFNAWCRGDFAVLSQRQARLLELGQLLAPTRPRQLMVLHYNTAVCETQLGQFISAKRSLNRAWDIARRQGDAHLVPAILMLLSLVALHEDRPEMALEYAELAQNNGREFESDESVLLSWYLALAQLAMGQLERAVPEWAARRPLEPSIENWLELGWMLRALQHVTGSDYHGEPPLDAEARALAQAWETELAALQESFPAPPALAKA